MFYPVEFVWGLYFPLSMCKSCVFVSNAQNYLLENLSITKPRDHFAKICTEEEVFNLVPRVLRLFCQRLVAGRDSGEME